MGFRPDGASIMIDKQNEVAAYMKEKVYVFFTSIHCMAHSTNLAAIDATKVGPCKDITRELNALLNLVAVHFKKS